jgi:Carboxypeptidase regulatory-like domain
MRKLWISLCLATTAFALLTAFAYAGISEGVLDGVVLNGKGTPVAFAAVVWQGADGKAPHALRTNGNGHFRIAGIHQGLYDIRAEALGMTSEWEHNVFVRSGRVVSVTLRLTHAAKRNGTSK